MTNETNQTEGITMQETKEEALQARLIYDVLTAFDKYVNKLVERRFQDMVENTKALKLMDDGLKVAIAEMVDDKLDEHNADHMTEDDLDRYMRRLDIITESRAYEIARDVIAEDVDVDNDIETWADNNLEDKIKEVLSEATLSVSMG